MSTLAISSLITGLLSTTIAGFACGLVSGLSPAFPEAVYTITPIMTYGMQYLVGEGVITMSIILYPYSRILKIIPTR